MQTQSHDGVRRYRAMTTNISKCFNGVLKGARDLPIAAIVEFTWSKLVAYFHYQHKEITHDLLEGKRWSTQVMSTYLKIGVNRRNTMSSHLTMNMLYIKQLLHTTSIALEGETTVMKFGYWKEHVVVGNGKTLRSRVHMQLEYVMCQALIRPHIFLCYSLKYVINTYSHAFTVPKSESLRRDAMGPKWLPNLELLWAKG